MGALDPHVVVVLSYSGGEGAGDDAARDCSYAILGCGCGADGRRGSRTSGAGAGSVPWMDGAPGKRARRSSCALVYAADTDEEGSRGGVRTRTRTPAHAYPHPLTQPTTATHKPTKTARRSSPRSSSWTLLLAHPPFTVTTPPSGRRTQTQKQRKRSPPPLKKPPSSPQKRMRSKRPPYPHVKEHTTPAHLRHRRRGGRVWRAARERRGRSQGGTC
ncbi:hypothetical protein B0H13DRAFT_1028490 [Mycena leptocephala]|nr:hypothetical protein B0H13DRAFT_1028490 [Mycena leptocephala]